ncbi:MAG: hypothetical protein Q4D90_06845 [bacterium]|nr:hypothetical protein [bacterium]
MATGLATVLFSVNIYLPIILSLILILISLVAITLFKENSDVKKEDNSIVSFNKQALSYVFQNKILLNLLLLMTCCTVIIMNNNSYCQPLLLEKGMDIKILGTLMLAYNLLMSVGSKISKRLTNIYFPYGILFLFCICSIFIGSRNLYLAIILFAVHRFLNGLIWPLLTAATNPLIPSDIRATVLSYQSMMTNVISMLVSPVVGIALDAVGLKLFYVSFGAIFAIIIAGLCMMRKK